MNDQKLYALGYFEYGARSTETASDLRFPVRRDQWDTVSFFRSFFSSALSGMVMIVAAIYLLNGDGMRGWGWCLLAFGIFSFLIRVGVMVCLIWDRYAEEYVMTADALVFEHGYIRHRIPYAEITALHPMKVSRMTALKPAHRINYRTRFGRGGVDAYPLNDENFLEELASRCPHLEREGPRMRLREEVATATQS
jgi:hypothetical protein